MKCFHSSIILSSRPRLLCVGAAGAGPRSATIGIAAKGEVAQPLPRTMADLCTVLFALYLVRETRDSKRRGLGSARIVLGLVRSEVAARIRPGTRRRGRKQGYLLRDTAQALRVAREAVLVRNRVKAVPVVAALPDVIALLAAGVLVHGLEAREF